MAAARTVKVGVPVTPDRELTLAEIVDYVKCYSGHLDFVRSSLARLGREEIENHAGDLLMIAVNHRGTEITDMLLDKGLRSGWALDAAVYQNDVEVVKKLLRAGCHPSPAAEAAARRLLNLEIARVIASHRAEKAEFKTDQNF